MRHREGVFAVPMVHSTLLIQLRDPASRLLAYDPPPPGYNGPFDDIIVFAHSVQYRGLTMHLDNRDFYGFLLAPLEDEATLEQERSVFLHLKLQRIGNAVIFNDRCIHVLHCMYCHNPTFQLQYRQTNYLFNCFTESCELLLQRIDRIWAVLSMLNLQQNLLIFDISFTCSFTCFIFLSKAGKNW